ncbi:YhcN/YlaJ family sporulation lipoprotein [Neobacillus mesonae]|uniref:Sporulation protein n=1 Tax=Neobacillus mesonae TaxID=1193713 RepID=A0A3T0I3A1_9BACI|nr:YhcN/YlaJ family sporulation lipoprotein [Neobacillus mesonae]AZU63829.1 sporulation protein [Neobacillus mesonae]MED4204656.1 YhcN/YlaJ family sporulation lipoprotein [Neobacillus mesonae]
MKKIAITLGLCAITALTGCQKNMGNNDIYEESGNTINVNNKRHELYREGAGAGVRNVSNDYGFVRHQKSPIMNDNTTNDHRTAIDREQLAHLISKYSVNLPNVHDAATLVTDKEVLVAYDTDSKDRNMTADQVKRTAMSVVPRYFHVYVTDNKALIQDVENLASLDSTNRKARDQVNYVINKMKKSPQGNIVNTGEDANGLSKEDQGRGMTR